MFSDQHIVHIIYEVDAWTKKKKKTWVNVYFIFVKI